MLKSLSVSPISRNSEGQLLPQVVRSMKQLGKSGDLLIVCYGARRVLRFTYVLESLQIITNVYG